MKNMFLHNSYEKYVSSQQLPASEHDKSIYTHVDTCEPDDVYFSLSVVDISSSAMLLRSLFSFFVFVTPSKHALISALKNYTNKEQAFAEEKFSSYYYTLNHLFLEQKHKAGESKNEKGSKNFGWNG